MRLNKLSYIAKLLVAVTVAIVAVAVSCCLGSSDITLHDIFMYLSGHKDELSGPTALIIGKIRIPRAFTAALIGGSLAVIGSIMQGLFKNPMADPSILGISSGSALGATISILIGASGAVIGGSITGTYLFAILGALITWGIVFSIARLGGEFDSSSTLLAGVAISSIMSGLITMLMTLHKDNLEKIYMWMLGSFTFSTPSKLYVLLVAAIIFNTIIFIFAPRIDILKLGKETSATLGVNSTRTLGLLMTASSMLLAFCVANSGIIGFVGLIIPHVVSFFRIYKARQKAIMCFFVGATFMVICDTLSKTIAAPGEVAVGAITSIIGGPYFLFLLLKNRRSKA